MPSSCCVAQTNRLIDCWTWYIIDFSRLMMPVCSLRRPVRERPRQAGGFALPVHLPLANMLLSRAQHCFLYTCIPLWGFTLAPKGCKYRHFNRHFQHYFNTIALLQHIILPSPPEGMRRQRTPLFMCSQQLVYIMTSLQNSSSVDCLSWILRRHVDDWDESAQAYPPIIL